MKLFVGAKAVVIHEGRVLLTREGVYEDGCGSGLWDMPGGRLEEGETVLEALLREVKEEVGLTVSDVGNVLGVFDAFPTIRGQKCQIVRIYFAVSVEDDIVSLGSDHDAYDWVDPNMIGEDKELMTEIPEMLAVAKDLV